MLKKLKSAERLFLLLKKYPPLSISRNKGKVIHDIQKLVNESPKCWLDIITLWRSLHSQEVKQEHLCQEYPDSKKRKLQEEGNTRNKKKKKEVTLEIISDESQIEAQERCDTKEVHKDLSQGRSSLEKIPQLIQEKSVESSSCFSFRVSCRCSGALAKTFTAQEMGRIIGIALMKSFGWKADLRNPDIEIFVHLNDMYSVIGIPLFRLPLASREYIKTAGLRSTIAWAMTSLAEIKAGAFVLDPTCGLGTVLLEAAIEWPNVHYFGIDISDSQLQGAYSNIKSAAMMDKIELLKASVTVLHEWVSKLRVSLDIYLHLLVSLFERIALPFPSESIDVVLADIPFGKKFKITKDMKILPDVFQELERVVCAGGTVVLLLSQELFRSLPSGIADDPQLKNHNSVAAHGDCTQNATVSVKSNTPEKSISPKTVSSSAQVTGKEHVSNKRTALGSLLLIESFEVSLGKTDAFICKYKKITDSPARM
ncbi:THUMP domain-containing protein 2 isoform X3 [Varanus komodoensis]|nr:THUMP domain-containing protein 2 isoform X3 [Varanus komodoensis]XP_044285153.1 THUMP domain-containing protein 2 isoform X3 [Varanus komodoensis]